MKEKTVIKLASTLAVMYGCAAALVVGYHVDPVKASWSGHTDTIPPNNYVSQFLTCCWDSLDRIELFAGAKGNGGTYRAGVVLDGDEIMWSNGVQGQSESWVKFEDWNTQVAFTKGKTYEVRFTRSGGDSYA